MSNVTTSQIAEKLNLSRNTVSKALNNNSGVSQSTRDLVISTALDMGYKNISEESLSNLTENSAHKKDICLLVHQKELTNGFWNRILEGIEKHFAINNGRIILGIINGHEETKMELPSVLKDTYMLAGVIMIGVFKKQYYELVKSIGIPMVTVDTYPITRKNKLICDVILTSNENGIFNITENIILQNIEDIAFVGQYKICQSLTERWRGYRNAMNHYGLSINSEYDILHSSMQPATLAKIILDMRKIPRALVCVNDHIANEVVRELHKKGFKVPQDVIVSGFDDFDFIPSPFDELTSVHFDIEELGKQAARQVLFRIENPDSSKCIIQLESFVKLRDSTDASL